MSLERPLAVLKSRRRPTQLFSLPNHDGHMRNTFIVALLLLLASCASSGLYNMSDNWCAAHLEASAARCLPDQQRLAYKEQERVASNVAKPND